jgi:mono/diheme cytochrome c family protein
MSPPGRPKGEYRRAQPEGTLMSRGLNLPWRAGLLHDSRRSTTGIGVAMMQGSRLIALCAAVFVAGAMAQPAADVFRGADLALGERLLKEHRCAACHASKVGGDGSSIYRPAGRVNTPAALNSMVERCNTEMGLGMFPEDVASVAAVLNRDHYRFK